MAKVSYYIFVIPLSYLPLVVLYAIMDIFYLLLITIIPYRKKVIIQNIERSFPNKTKSEKAKIKRQFYRHLTQLLAESVKGLSISESELKRRITVKNPEIMDKLHANGKNVLLVSGHYNNWEIAAMAFDVSVPHHAIGIYTPLNDKFFDKKFGESRTKYGVEIITKSMVPRSFISNKNKLFNFREN